MAGPRAVTGQEQMAPGKPEFTPSYFNISILRVCTPSGVTSRAK